VVKVISGTEKKIIARGLRIRLGFSAAMCKGILNCPDPVHIVCSLESGLTYHSKISAVNFGSHVSRTAATQSLRDLSAALRSFFRTASSSSVVPVVRGFRHDPSFDCVLNYRQ